MSQKFKNDMNILTEKLSAHITKPFSRDSILTGFVDSLGNLYPITLDTKVLSKVVEFIFLPVIKKFCDQYNYTLQEPQHQNHYPDLTFIDNFTNKKYAVDIKTTYRITEKKFNFERTEYILKKNKSTYIVLRKNDEDELENIISGDIVSYSVQHAPNSFSSKIQATLNTLINENAVNGMTLGAYTGYFKNRESYKNILYPYSEYDGHYVLGMIYSREELDDIEIKNISEYKTINSPIYDIKMFFIEKFKIASTSPGSGNTKNIGSIKKENALINGDGPFQTIEEFDSFWLSR
ncbi:type II restriction endonuclease [Cetobacterium sp. SF1]|uniref:type II restriction endonuclease n=1 Tax=Cetobacterium sp. SF1 TaxID=3417654 RepID=UPI003CF526F7